MIKPKRGVCSKCGKECFFANASKKLCSKCNSERLNEGKPKKKTILKKRTPIKVKRKSTGEKDIFIEIWEERPHECKWCGIMISEPSVSNFAHIKPKSTHPQLRLDKSNIEIYCAECHDAFDCRGIDKFNSRKDLYRK